MILMERQCQRVRHYTCEMSDTQERVRCLRTGLLRYLIPFSNLKLYRPPKGSQRKFLVQVHPIAQLTNQVVAEARVNETPCLASDKKHSPPDNPAFV